MSPTARLMPVRKDRAKAGKLASGVAHVTDMLKLGIHVGLGNDGFAGSNDSADILREADLAAKLQKVTTLDPTALPAEQAFAMATIGGAQVLGMESEIGSIEAGKRADLFLLNLNQSTAVPLYSVYSFLAYAAHAGDVEDVWVNGRQVVGGRQVLTLNSGEVFVVPKGIEHRPVARGEVHILLIEPTSTPNTGDKATAAPRILA